MNGSIRPVPIGEERAHREELSHHEQMLDAQGECVPCKLCGSKAIITDAGYGAGYYIRCSNTRNRRLAEGCLISDQRLGGWAYNVMEWWNRLHAATHPAQPSAVVGESRRLEAGRMAQRGADNLFHELNRDPNWQPSRADYQTIGYLLQNIAGTAAAPSAPPSTDAAGGEGNLEAQRQTIEACAKICDRMAISKTVPMETNDAAWNLAIAIRALRPNLATPTAPNDDLRAALEAVVDELSEVYRATADTKADARRRIETEPCMVAARAALGERKAGGGEG